MINKQTATLGFQLLSVMDKLFTLTAPVPGPLLFFSPARRALPVGHLHAEHLAASFPINPDGHKHRS
jgi:hypothetical protein